MNKDLLAQLIHKYKVGTASVEEIFVLEQFWRTAQQRSVIDGMTPEQVESLREAIFSKIHTRIGFEAKPQKQAFKSRQVFMRSWRYAVAASIILLIATVAIVRWPVERDVEIRTAFGEQRAVKLPDNSDVTLNGNTILRYKTNWNETEDREVWIEGEGFFSVKHTKNDSRFVVHASDRLNVEVLGTKFNVRSRALKSEVMLAEGKVKLDMKNSQAASVYLKPGELAVLTDKKLVKEVVKDQRYTSWLTHTLMFDRTPLRDVARLLHDTYGLEVQFGSEQMMDLELSGEISSASADDILKGISQIFNLKIERKDQRVLIFSERQ